ncbi:MAG: tRNA (N6-isopentenyl adenosine(37)-C2)-methylthiotransferase MiaB [Actinobacteria bacterium]|nr:tRNA (N6-isopentenyl adenosine(37)-C2)-methylthiotransferase MiaB [Actinomycetota bacterium]
MKKVFIETYGCQMNEYDTEIVKTILQQEDYEFTSEEKEADVVLLNTCSVRENANRKVYGRIHSIKHRRNGEPVMIGVLGCMSTNFRKQLLEDPKLPIDFVVGPDSYKRLPKILHDVEKTGEKGFDVTLSEFETYSDVYPTREKGVNAWIAVMRGCNNFCSFCVVPYTRGRERSRSPENIVDEVKRLADAGFSQVTLLGQNVNSYNYQGKSFAHLLTKVGQVNGIKRIRFTSPHPKDFPHDLLHVVADNPKVCKHIHLPLQAGSNRVLDLMRRTYTKKEYLHLVDDIRSHYEKMVLTTDIIVGFPTETDEEFEETFAVVDEVEYDSAFIFKYSQRRGTVAAKKYPDDVPEEVKTERIIRLNELQKQKSLKKNRAHIGQIHQILIEEETTKRSDKDVQGRNDGNKLVILPKGNLHVGQFVNARITDASANVLKGKVVHVPD